MKIVLVFSLGLCLLPVFSGAALASSKMPSPPSSALFYPNEIHLTVEERLIPESLPGKGRGLVVVLPATAYQSSFSVTVNDQPVNGFYWREDVEQPVPLLFNAATPSDDAATFGAEGAERRALLGAIASIQEEIDKTIAALNVTNARMELWKSNKPSEKECTPDDLLKLDRALAELLPVLHEAKSRDMRTLRELQNRIEEAEAALRTLEKEQNRPVAVIPFDGPDGKAALVRYSYLMPGACDTAYRVTAYPAKDVLSIEQDAFLFQPSGQVWKDVDVYISTTRRDTAIRPQTLAPWRIAFGAKGAPFEADPMRAETKLLPMSSKTDEHIDMELSAPAEPVQAEKATFRLWSLGKRTIDSNVSVNFPLASDEYKASYYYTLQPSVNPKGFLTAELSLDKALELPAGTARFFVDDVAVGEQPMSLNGNKATLFFGTDPQITASLRDLKRSTGESGFINKEQNELWHWEIVVRNARSRAVDVRIEDPMPDAVDAAIKVAVESTPKPEESITAQQLGAVKVYLWKFTLQPGEMQTIEHKVQIHAPADKDLFPGRNR